MPLSPFDVKQAHIAILDGRTIRVSVMTNDKRIQTDDVRPEDLPARLSNIAIRLKDTARRI